MLGRFVVRHIFQAGDIMLLFIMLHFMSALQHYVFMSLSNTITEYSCGTVVLARRLLKKALKPRSNNLKG